MRSDSANIFVFTTAKNFRLTKYKPPSENAWGLSGKQYFFEGFFCPEILDHYIVSVIEFFDQSFGFTWLKLDRNGLVDLGFRIFELDLVLSGRKFVL